jgi:hypothetical protein
MNLYRMWQTTGVFECLREICYNIYTFRRWRSILVDTAAFEDGPENP